MKKMKGGVKGKSMRYALRLFEHGPNMQCQSSQKKASAPYLDKAKAPKCSISDSQMKEVLHLLLSHHLLFWSNSWIPNQ